MKEIKVKLYQQRPTDVLFATNESFKPVASLRFGLYASHTLVLLIIYPFWKRH